MTFTTSNLKFDPEFLEIRLFQRQGRVVACQSRDLGSIPSWDRLEYFPSTTMALTLNNPSYDSSVHKYLPWSQFQVIRVPRNSGTNFKLEGVNVTWSRYILIHFYSLAVEACFYSDLVECFPCISSDLGLIPGWNRLKYFCTVTYISSELSHWIWPLY